MLKKIYVCVEGGRVKYEYGKKLLSLLRLLFPYALLWVVSYQIQVGLQNGSKFPHPLDQDRNVWQETKMKNNVATYVCLGYFERKVFQIAKKLQIVFFLQPNQPFIFWESSLFFQKWKKMKWKWNFTSFSRTWTALNGENKTIFAQILHRKSNDYIRKYSF